MMHAELKEQTVYEALEPHDTYFFKLGSHGMVCFHGKNYSLKKTLSPEQITALLADPAFYRVSNQYYANVSKVYAIQGNTLLFRDEFHGIKTLPASRRAVEEIRRRKSM
jgi:DNA-binding LytR/AlgR family response regulator